MAYHSKKDSKHDSSTEYAIKKELYVNSRADKSVSKSKMATKEKNDKAQVEQEKRLRREIANSNERRRMLAINSGFESLKTLLPHVDGDKLSKAAILHQTTDYITAMESEKTRLLAQNARLKEQLIDLGYNADSDIGSTGGSPPPKRKKRDTESSDEGIGLATGDFDEPTLEELKKEMLYLRCQLDRERRLRMMLEEQTRNLEAQLYPERLRQIATQVQAQMRYQEEKEKYLEEQRRIQEQQESALAARQAAHRSPAPPTSTSPSAAVAAATAAATTTTATATATPTTPTTPTPNPPSPAPSNTNTQTGKPALESNTETMASASATMPSSTGAKRPQPPSVNTAASSMSRRNLETIVEAIRHLEGDSIDFDLGKKDSQGSADMKSTGSADDNALFASSASGVSTGSEHSDSHSDTSGRDTPPSKISSVGTPYALTATTTTVQLPLHRHHHHNHHQHHPHSHLQPQQIAASSGSTAQTTATLLHSDRYPVASQLLQHSPAHFVPQRPAVIVPNLS